MTYQWRYDGGYVPPRETTPIRIYPINDPVTPALVLAARRGFVEAYVIKGFGWFESEQAATDFFDDRAHKGHWSDQAYRDYAAMDPRKEDE